MLPIFLSQLRELNMMQTSWSAQLQPLIANPLSSGVLLKKVVLSSGDNTINHTLGKVLQGWIPIRFHGGWAQIYDKQDTNTLNKLTLILNASAGVTVDLMVF